MRFGTTSIQGNLDAQTTNAAISQTGALTIAGTTSFTTGSGDITLLNTNNSFGIVPITVSSTGSVQISPCSATNSCKTPDPSTNVQALQARQDVITTNAGLTQQSSAFKNSYMTVLEPKKGQPPSGSQTPTPPSERIKLGQGSLEFNIEESTCTQASGCNLRSSTQDAGKLTIQSTELTGARKTNFLGWLSFQLSQRASAKDLMQS